VVVGAAVDVVVNNWAVAGYDSNKTMIKYTSINNTSVSVTVDLIFITYLVIH